MALPNEIASKDLAKQGFTIKVSEKRVKHERYNSFRNKCAGCGVWVKQTQGGKSGKLYCKKCFIKPSNP